MSKKNNKKENDEYDESEKLKNDKEDIIKEKLIPKFSSKDIVMK